MVVVSVVILSYEELVVSYNMLCSSISPEVETIPHRSYLCGDVPFDVLCKCCWEVEDKQGSGGTRTACGVNTLKSALKIGFNSPKPLRIRHCHLFDLRIQDIANHGIDRE
jgi:hypothetical protein